ncbi:MAG: MBL fold metallo-hydrolase [Planctomycetota bacterium]
MNVQHFYDERTGSLSYIVTEEATKTALVIDPVLDFDAASGRVWNASNERMTKFLEDGSYTVPYVLETHVHADHFSGAQWFRKRFSAKTVISAHVCAVQKTLGPLFNMGKDFPTDGRQFDILIDDGATLEAGGLSIKVIPTPGHTPASISYLIGDALFVGDSIFQPDSGTARCDFPGGSAAELYDSIQRMYALPDQTRIFTLHDYQPGGRELQFVSTVAEQKQSNRDLRHDTTKEEFIALRKKLEEGKDAPRLILPSLQVNLRGGHLPDPESNGVAYLKIPLNAFGAS